uniref:Uncharacterized protein n=1 Tax=viral metagenome TaxID=1070528 RepID=A0A6M3Y6C0_9ZZZZ
MITDEALLKDKGDIQEKILTLESAIAQRQQELQQLQTQLVRFIGVLDYITDNLKQKEGEKCSEET